MRGREIDSTYLTSNSKALKMKFEFTKKKIESNKSEQVRIILF